jgi:nucleotide-binding universal stress UspA family protein
VADTVKRILAACDLSPRSDLALGRALLLALADDGTVTVLHVHSSARDRAAVEQQVRDHLARVRPDATCEVVLRVGAPFVEIIRTARTVGADLIAMGAQGAERPLSFTGTTAERVARKSDRPVLVVRQRPIGRYRRVLTAVDGSEHATAALRFALHAFPDAEHHVVHAVVVPGEPKMRGADPSDVDALRQTALDAARGEITRALGSTWSGALVVRYGHPVEVISGMAVEWDADLVVVATHGQGVVRHVLLGSTAERTLRETPNDVLLVRPAGVTFELP